MSSRWIKHPVKESIDILSGVARREETKFMVPLHTVQGLSSAELQIIVNGRKVYIWGSGPIGRRVLVSLRKCGISPYGFVDGRASEVNTSAYSLQVSSPDKVLKDADSFVIIANLGVKDFAEKSCVEAGRVKGKDYLTHFQIQRPEAAVDIAGMCNVSCSCCPRGNSTSLLPDGYMPLAAYRKVLDKLLVCLPNLTNVELYTWGEPFLNPDVASIIKITEEQVPCTVATNLQVSEMVEPVINANPTWLTVTINGCESEYEKNMKGASWERLVVNLRRLSSLKKWLNSTTDVTLQLYSYGNNRRDCQKMLEFAASLGFSAIFGTCYLNPYENYLRYVQKEALSETVLREIRRSPWDLDEMLGYAGNDRHRPCLCQRIFPIINWNLSVALCHVYYGPVIAENFLEISWEELMLRRHQCPQCISCQKAALHRLDLDVLKKKANKSC